MIEIAGHNLFFIFYWAKIIYIMYKEIDNMFQPIFKKKISQ